MIRHPKRFSGSANWPRQRSWQTGRQANSQQPNWQTGKDELNAGLKSRQTDEHPPHWQTKRKHFHIIDRKNKE